MLRYYVYVSRTKVNMLHAQIQHQAPRKVRTEFRAGPKFAGETRTTETETEANLYTRLEEVAAYLQNRHLKE